MNFLRQLYINTRDAWQQLSVSARINISLAAAAVVALMVFVIIAGARPQYVTLSDGIAPDQVGKIVETLEQAGVAYHIENNNRTIKVPLEERSAMQLKLVEAGLPVGRKVAPGFEELFAESDLMTNRWLQDVKLMRAIKGELERQLNAFDFVDYSIVTIREAKDEIFVADQRPSEALVTLAVNRPVSKREVKGIVSMISAAGGANLHDGNITVAQTNGEFLHLPPDSPFTALASSRLELRVAEEKEREAKLQRKLDDLGIHGTVSVSAKMNFDAKEVTATLAAEGAEVSTYEMTTTLQSTENLPQGAPGALANVPEGTAAPGGVITTEENNESIANYEPSITTTKTTTDPGNVVKYLVSLVVEGDYTEQPDPENEGQTLRTYAGLAEDRREMLIALAKATVGEGEAETEVTVHDYPFDTDEISAAVAAVEEAASARRWETVQQYVVSAAQILAIIAGFFFVRRFFQRAIHIPVEIEEEEIVEDIRMPEASQEDVRRERVAGEIQRLVTDQPDTIAALVRTWLSEEED